ncbi:MAG: hypothetical protein WC867_00715 [Candidatus Pacearchaeota archaeon]|jgi:hypothetical protein
MSNIEPKISKSFKSVKQDIVELHTRLEEASRKQEELIKAISEIKTKVKRTSKKKASRKK